MNYKCFFVLLILLAISSIQYGFNVELAIDTVTFISSVITISQSAEQKLTTTDSLNLINKNITELSETIANRFDKLISYVNNIEIDLKNYVSTRQLERQYGTIYDHFDRIDFLYNETQIWSRYIKENKPWDIKSKTKQMISLDRDYPHAVLHELKRIFFPTSKKSTPTFLNSFRNLLLQPKCDANITAHYHLFSLYKQIIYTEVQGFAAAAFSYMWISIKNGDILHEMREVKNERIQNIIDYTNLFKSTMKITRNIIRRCDVNHRDNKNIIGHKTYATLNNIFYTVALNLEQFKVYDTIEINKRLSSHHDYAETCPGLITNCQFTKSIEVCRRNETDQTNNKHYYWMRVTNFEKVVDFGDTNRPCQLYKFHKDLFRTQYVETTPIPVYCDCIDASIHTGNRKIRAFSMLWSQTNNNMVATGARLVAKDRMIHIQLREAKLLPYGEIDKNTERWVPLPTFVYYENFPKLAVYENGERLSLNENIDFVSINHLYARTICLQKLTFDEKHLLSGVRFTYEYLDDSSEKHFQLEADYVEFDYQHGNISSTIYRRQSCKWLPELILNNPDDPLKFDTHSHDSKENQFIKIRASDLIKDVSQTTIPFFDLLEVAPKTSVPITGIELFHKGQLDGTSGGYISLKLYPLDLTMYMNSPSPLEIFNIENKTTIPELKTQPYHRSNRSAV